MKGSALEIKTLPLSKLNPAAYNPRKDLTPEDPEYQKLKKSILEFDLVEPIVWNEKTGNVVGGHQRLKILKELKREKTNVVVVKLDESKEIALNLALNKIAGYWDFPKLKDLIADIDTGDFDIEITGFSESELFDLFGHAGSSNLLDDDNQPAAGTADKPKIQIDVPGGVWFDSSENIQAEINRICDSFGMTATYPVDKTKKTKKQRF
jgi:hypothetical protein